MTSENCVIISVYSRKVYVEIVYCLSWDKVLYKFRIQGKHMKFRLYLEYPQVTSELIENWMSSL